MSQFAQIDENGVVLQLVESDTDIFAGGAFGDPTRWKLVLPEDTAAIGYTYDQASGLFHPPLALVVPLALVRIASAQLLVAEWEVTGIERSEAISGAFIADVDTAWVYFAEEQPDTNYILMPADGFTKFTDHVEVTRPGLSELSFLVFRVQ